jgi:hypothetical protein
MTLSSTLLASGVNADSLRGVLVGAAAVGVAFLTLRHHRAVFQWMKRMARRERNGVELQEATRLLRDVSAKICEYAQEPSGAEEFAVLTQVRHRVEATAGETDLIDVELRTVLNCLDRYLATELASVGADGVVTSAEHHARLRTAMQQEKARGELAAAVGAAQLRIRALCRAS